MKNLNRKEIAEAIAAKYKKRSLPKPTGKRKGTYRKCKLCGKFMTCSEIYFDRKLCHRCMVYACGNYLLVKNTTKDDAVEA